MLAFKFTALPLGELFKNKQTPVSLVGYEKLYTDGTKIEVLFNFDFGDEPSLGKTNKTQRLICVNANGLDEDDFNYLENEIMYRYEQLQGYWPQEKEGGESI